MYLRPATPPGLNDPALTWSLKSLAGLGLAAARAGRLGLSVRWPCLTTLALVVDEESNLSDRPLTEPLCPSCWDWFDGFRRWPLSILGPGRLGGVLDSLVLEAPLAPEPERALECAAGTE